MDKTITVELTCNPGQLARLRELLEVLTHDFSALANGDADEDGLRRQFDELSGTLEAYRSDMELRREYFRETEKSLADKGSRASFFQSLEASAGFADEIRAHLIETKQRVRLVEEITERVFKITSRRTLLNKIAHPGRRKVIAQSLTQASVLVDRVRELRSDLLESLKELSEKGLDDTLGVPDIAAIELPEPDSSAPLSELEPPDPTPSPDRERVAARAAPGEAAAPAGRPRRDDAKTGPTNKKPLSSSDFKKVRAALNEWSRWHPLAPSGLGNAIGVISAVKERAVKVNIVALWGTRMRVDLSVPYQGNSVNGAPVPSLWDLKASPPREFETGRESFQAPGEERVADCSKCGGSGTVSGEAGGGACEACRGAGKLFYFRMCETEYSTTELWDTDYKGELPTELLALAEGESEQDSVTALVSGRVEAGLEKKCSAIVGRRVSSFFLQEVVEPFLTRPSLAGAGDEAPEVRLVRARIELFRVPVLRLTCGFKDPSHPKSLSQFQVWLYGSQQRLHFSELPRMWTLKAALWLAGLGVAGAGFGFALGKLLRWAL